MLLYNNLLAISEDWLKYAIRANLLNEDKNNLEDLRNKAINCEKIKLLLNDITNFHSIAVTNHKNPDLPIYKLIFLLDIGLDSTTPQIKAAINEILKYKDENGVYLSLINVPKHFKGTGDNVFGWCLCDAPLLLYALVKAHVDYDKYIKAGVEYLLTFYKDNGFPCTVSSSLGKFRGPGRKDDCCPYATLLMAKLLSDIPEYKNSSIVYELVEVLLSLWEKSAEKHPYMFYMGTDFRKLKAPEIWYDIISVADVLSRFENVRKDKRFIEMISIIKEKQDDNGLFTPEAIYLKYKNWDFGQKKIPSAYLTYLCLKILKQAGYE